jgi:hypothetical protein
MFVLCSYNRSFMLRNQPIESDGHASFSDRFFTRNYCRFGDKKTILHPFTVVRLRYYKSFSINNLAFRVLENIFISHHLLKNITIVVISTLIISSFSIDKLVFQSLVVCDKILENAFFFPIKYHPYNKNNLFINLNFGKNNPSNH